MRRRIWNWVVLKSKLTKPGVILSRKFLLFTRAILFPLDTFYWKMQRSRGYQPERDSWIIEGVEYPAIFFLSLEVSILLEKWKERGWAK